MYKIIFSIMFFGLLSCSSSKKSGFDPAAETNDFIHFGAGGGFTGKVTSYYFTKTGKIFQLKDEKYIKIATIPSQVTEQIFKNYTSLGLDKMILNDPGNRYSFIVRKENNESKTIKWGNNPLDNKIIQTYFNILMKLVKDILPKSEIQQ
jgi:hypothetical protein